MLILVTNDDGINALGIQCLAERLAVLGEIVVVAPDRERSGAGHSLTLHRPLRAEQIQPNFFAIDGTPTDCVNLGIHGLLSRRPNLVVSGINRGANLGDDVTYSGTVAAAMEATLMGVPAFAVSLAVEHFIPDQVNDAALYVVAIAKKILEQGLPPDTFLNVNIPPGQIKGSRLTRQGRRVYGDVVVEKLDPRGRKYYWIGGGKPGFQREDGTDFHALDSGYVSITPLHLDLTNYRSFELIASWEEEIESSRTPERS